MNEIDPAKLDSLSQRFKAKVQESFPDQDMEMEFSDRLEVIFPEKHPKVGNIHIWLDGDEVTVGIGQLFHTHFEAYLDNTKTQDEAEESAVSESIDFIRDFIEGKIILHVRYCGDRAVGASVSSVGEGNYYSTTGSFSGKDILARILKRKKTVKSFKWTGEIK